MTGPAEPAFLAASAALAAVRPAPMITCGLLMSLPCCAGSGGGAQCVRPGCHRQPAALVSVPPRPHCGVARRLEPGEVTGVRGPGMAISRAVAASAAQLAMGLETSDHHPDADDELPRADG